MVGHGVAVAVVAAVIAGIERRQGSSNTLLMLVVLASQAPGQAVLALAALLVAVAIPGTVSFGAEVMLFLAGIFSTAGLVVVLIAGLSLVLTAGYLLRLARVMRVFRPRSR